MTLLSVGGRLLSVGGSLLNTGATVIQPDPEPTPGGDIPSANLVGHWDVSSRSAGTISSITDASPAGKNATTSGKIVPRTLGLLSGLYSEAGAGSYVPRQPVIADYSVSATGIAVGAGQTFTVALAWTRPNQRQPNAGAFSSAPVDLLTIDGTVVVRLGGAGLGADALTLFPNGTPVSAGTLAIRHSHWLKVVFSGSTVDLHLGGTKIISGAANQITLGSTAALSFLPSAQCIFHKAAAWSKAHTSAEDAALVEHMASFNVGARYAANFIGIGQSGINLLIANYVLQPTLSKNLTYLTGSPSANLIVGGAYQMSGTTIFSGQGLYGSAANYFLDGRTGDPSTWPLGTNGNTFMSALDAMSADDRASTAGIFWYWSESDTNMLTYAKKAEYGGALRRAFSLIRAKLGRTPAQLPIMVISALPFATDTGGQAHREVMQDLADDASMNVKIMMANTWDAIGQSDAWDAATGIESGAGNNSHRDDVGTAAFVRRSIAPLARATIQSQAANSRADRFTAIDASIPVTGGPKFVAAQWEGGTSVLVTVQHDGGNDIAVPLRAALGVGWTLMDGVSASVAGNPGAPGALILATACARVSATQLRLTLASAPQFAAKAQLYYGYGDGLDAADKYATIGRGNAPVDNFSQVTLTPGWRIGADLGAAAQVNYPLQITPYGVALT